MNENVVISCKISNQLEKAETIFNKKRNRGLTQDTRYTVDGVLDSRTRNILEKFKKRDIYTMLYGTISTGKEANVYCAIKKCSENKNMYVALKIFKTSILLFKDRRRYVEGEYRFSRGYNSASNPRKMVKQWAEKEFRNMKRLLINGLRGPLPIELRGHVIAMSFIGIDEYTPAIKLKEYDTIYEVEWKRIYVEIISLLKVLYDKCKLVHGDFSEYNILYHQGHPYIIDISQSIDVDNNNAGQFLFRDCVNITNFFRKKVYKIADETNLETDNDIDYGIFADNFVEDKSHDVSREINSLLDKNYTFRSESDVKHNDNCSSEQQYENKQFDEDISQFHEQMFASNIPINFNDSFSITTSESQEHVEYVKSSNLSDFSNKVSMNYLANTNKYNIYNNDNDNIRKINKQRFDIKLTDAESEWNKFAQSSNYVVNMLKNITVLEPQQLYYFITTTPITDISKVTNKSVIAHDDWPVFDSVYRETVYKDIYSFYDKSRFIISNVNSNKVAAYNEYMENTISNTVIKDTFDITKIQKYNDYFSKVCSNVVDFIVNPPTQIEYGANYADFLTDYQIKSLHELSPNDLIKLTTNDVKLQKYLTDNDLIAAKNNMIKLDRQKNKNIVSDGHNESIDNRTGEILTAQTKTIKFNGVIPENYTSKEWKKFVKQQNRLRRTTKMPKKEKKAKMK